MKKIVIPSYTQLYPVIKFVIADDGGLYDVDVELVTD